MRRTAWYVWMIDAGMFLWRFRLDDVRETNLVCSKCGAMLLWVEGVLQRTCDCCQICDSYNRLHADITKHIPYKALLISEWEELNA